MIIGVDANEANLTAHRVGINRYAFDLLHALYRLPSSDEFVIYTKTPPRSDLPQKRSGWTYRTIPFPRFWTQTRLPFDLFVHRPRPDVFVSLTHYAPRWSPVPVVLAVMDLGFLKFPDQFTRRDLSQLRSWTGYSVRQAKKILTISEFTKQDIVEVFGKSAADITVTYPGYSEELFKPTRDEAVLEKYGIRHPYFLFLSSLKPSKNVEGLIEAFSRLPKSDYRLVIAGKKAWLYDRVFSLVRHLKLTDRVIFTGFIEESEVPVLMSHAKAFVLPSFYEGFGIPVLEAMACGTPVVVSRVASLPEVAGPAGIYIDPDSPDSLVDGLQTAIGSKRSKFVQLGLARVKSFHWQDSARKTLEVIHQAVT